MIETMIDQDRLCAVFQTEPTVEEIRALVTQARESYTRIRIIDLTVPRAFQAKSDAMDLLTREWERIGQIKFLMNIEPHRNHPDERIAGMRAGLGN